MKRTVLMTAGSAMALLLAGCGTHEDASQNEPAGNTANALTADASDPFAQSQMRMNERMMAAVGTDVGDSWARKMIEHHQGAIDMSQIVLQQSPRADIADLARMTIEKQGKEIEDLRKLVKQGSPDPKSAEPYRSSMTQMHDAMMAASGSDISETFLRKMLAHHKGGVTMSDAALQNGVGGVLGQQVQKTRDNQQKEARMIEEMLRGETMRHAMQQAEVKTAEEAKGDSAPVAKATRAPRSTPKAPAAKAAPAPEAKAPESPAAPTCSPEHRAAGHC